MDLFDSMHVFVRVVERGSVRSDHFVLLPEETQERISTEQSAGLFTSVL